MQKLHANTRFSQQSQSKRIEWNISENYVRRNAAITLRRRCCRCRFAVARCTRELPLCKNVQTIPQESRTETASHQIGLTAVRQAAQQRLAIPVQWRTSVRALRVTATCTKTITTATTTKHNKCNNSTNNTGRSNSNAGRQAK